MDYFIKEIIKRIEAHKYEIDEISIQALQKDMMMIYDLEDIEGTTIEEKIKTADIELSEIIMVIFPDGNKLFK